MRLLLKVLLLAGIPLVVMGGIGTLLLAQGDTANGRSTFAVGVIIASVSGASVVYQVEHWSLAKQTLIHFALMAVTVLPAMLLSGWFDLATPTGWLLALGAYMLTGVVLWAVFFGIFTLVDRQKKPLGGEQQS